MDERVAEAYHGDGLRLERRVGLGGYSTVYSAFDEQCNHERVAVKIVRPPSRGAALDWKQELVALKELSDLPHVVGMRRCFIDTSGGGERPVVVMDLAPGKELFSIVQQDRWLCEDVARAIIHQVLETVAAMHRRGWIHRDLKLENIITDTDTNTSKIIDFGFAVRQREEGAHCEGVLGTAHYVAPEVVWRRNYDGRAVDMFAIGVMLYVMLYGRYPFDRGNFGVAPHMRQSEKRAFSASYSFPRHPTVSAEARSFIRSLLASEPASRLTAEEALRDQSWVRHPEYEMCDDPPSDPDSEEEETYSDLPNSEEEEPIGTFGKPEPATATPNTVGRCRPTLVEPVPPERTSSERKSSGEPPLLKSPSSLSLADWAKVAADNVHSVVRRLLYSK